MAGFPPEKKARAPKPGIPFDKALISKLIDKHMGNVSRVADTIGASRGGLRHFIDRHPDLQEQLKQCRERQLDELEKSCFDRAIETNDTTLQLFLLKTQGKSRGYDQNEARDQAQSIATAAFDYIMNQSKKAK